MLAEGQVLTHQRLQVFSTQLHNVHLFSNDTMLHSQLHTTHAYCAVSKKDP